MGTKKKTPRRLKKPTAAEVEKVLALRDEGLTYKEIDEKMGWPQARGARSWAIVNNPRAFRPTRGPYYTRRREAEGAPGPYRLDALDRVVSPQEPRYASTSVGAPPRAADAPVFRDRRQNLRRLEDRLHGALSEALRDLVAHHLEDLLREVEPPLERQTTTQES